MQIHEYLLKNANKTNTFNLVSGFSGGLFIAFICFSMLPFALESTVGGIFGVSAGMLAGVFISVLLDKNSERLSKIFAQKEVEGNRQSSNNMLSVGIMLSAGIIIHHFAEGMALSGLTLVSTSLSLKMFLIIGLHFIIETTAAAMALRRGGVSYFKIIIIAIMFALPLLLGYGTGMVLLPFMPYISGYCMSISSGIILYAACGEMLPEKETTIFHLPTIGACIGFIFGLFFTSL